MTLEILFPELANLYGESANAKYLAACAHRCGCNIRKIPPCRCSPPAGRT